MDWIRFKKKKNWSLFDWSLLIFSELKKKTVRGKKKKKRNCLIFFFTHPAWFGSSNLHRHLDGWIIFFRAGSLELKKQKQKAERGREVCLIVCWWKWQWHWAYCLVHHTQPDSVIEANEISSLGAWDRLASAVTELKRSHSAAVIHGKWADLSYSCVRPGEDPSTSVLPTPGGDENICFHTSLNGCDTQFHLESTPTLFS